MPLTPEQCTKIIEEVFRQLDDPASPASQRFRAAQKRLDAQFEPLIWSLEASEGLAPWQSNTSIADDPSRWHLWPKGDPRHDNPYFSVHTG